MAISSALRFVWCHSKVYQNRESQREWNRRRERKIERVSEKEGDRGGEWTEREGLKALVIVVRVGEEGIEKEEGGGPRRILTLTREGGALTQLRERKLAKNSRMQAARLRLF